MIEKTKNRAFTLIELIVVISIISLLVGVIAPSISKVRDLSFRAKSAAAIQELSAGAMQYKSEYGCYPLQTGIPNSGTYGSKISAAFGRLMLGYITVPGGGTSIDFKSSTYDRNPIVAESNDRFALTNSYDFKKQGGGTISEQYTPLDQWKKGEEMAILYYPSNIGNDGTTLSSVFDIDSNDTYASPKDLNDFSSTLRDNKFGTGSDSRIYNSDSFLLIAPGINREYFTDDDLKNF